METVSTMGTGSLGREIDLETLVEELQDHFGDIVDANFTSSGVVTVRLEEGGPAYTIFRTGSFQIRGAEDDGRLMKAADLFKKALSNLGVKIPEYQFQHITSVFMEDLNKDLNLELLTVSLGVENIEYEPEQFPGLIYRPQHLPVTLLIFSSGKIIVGGTTDENIARSAVQILQKEIS